MELFKSDSEDKLKKKKNQDRKGTHVVKTMCQEYAN